MRESIVSGYLDIDLRRRRFSGGFGRRRRRSLRVERLSLYRSSNLIVATAALVCAIYYVVSTLAG